MPSKRMLFCINPHAGKEEIRHHLLDVLAMWSQAGLEVTTSVTSQAGQLPGFLRSHGLSYDLVACCDGDFAAGHLGHQSRPGDFCERQYSRSGFVCRSG